MSDLPVATVVRAAKELLAATEPVAETSSRDTVVEGATAEPAIEPRQAGRDPD